MPTLNFEGKEEASNLTVLLKDLCFVSDKSYNVVQDSWETNQIIHGDNLEALNALLPIHKGHIDFIYIDPPYNTGNKGWVYDDSSSSHKNTSTNKHDRWLAMMYPRLKLLHELLKEGGSIVVSIDDNEVHHLKMLLDEIWGEDCAKTTLIWHKTDKPLNRCKDGFSSNTEYLLLYTKGGKTLTLNFDDLSTEYLKKTYKNPDNDPRGPWVSIPLFLRTNSNKEKELLLPWNQEKRTEKWFVSQDTLNRLWQENRIWFGQDGKRNPSKKYFLSDKKHLGVVPINLLKFSKVGTSGEGTRDLKKILPEAVFQTIKPVALIKYLIKKVTHKDALILDSFAGSGTTAQAVLELNKEDQGARKFILVEQENYADSITAERVRRLNGSFSYREIIL